MSNQFVLQVKEGCKKSSEVLMSGKIPTTVKMGRDFFIYFSKDASVPNPQVIQEN